MNLELIYTSPSVVIGCVLSIIVVIVSYFVFREKPLYDEKILIAAQNRDTYRQSTDANIKLGKIEELHSVRSINIGSYSIKSGDPSVSRAPQILPSVTGTIREENRRRVVGDHIYVGKHALDERSILTFKYPFSRSGILSRQDISPLLHQLGNSEYAVLSLPLSYNFTCILEELEFDNICIIPEPVCTLASKGLITGIVLDCGHEQSTATPVYTGSIVHYGIYSTSMGGQVLDTILHRSLLSNQAINWTSTTEMQIINEMKHSLCYVSLDPNNEQAKEESYQLPDKTSITIQNERYQVPEFLFNYNYEQEWYMPLTKQRNVQDLVIKSRISIPSDYRNQFSNVVTSGGSTHFKGFHTRLKKELNGLTVQEYGDAWYGAYLLYQLDTYRNTSMTRQEYDEHGANLLI